MRLSLTALLAYAGAVTAINCPDAKGCCMKSHKTCNAKWSADTCNRLAYQPQTGVTLYGPVYCGSCPTDCCTFEDETYKPDCTNKKSGCWTSAPAERLWGKSCT